MLKDLFIILNNYLKFKNVDEINDNNELIINEYNQYYKKTKNSNKVYLLKEIKDFKILESISKEFKKLEFEKTSKHVTNIGDWI